MLSPNDTGYGSTGSDMRASRAASRRELIKNKRTTRNTDMLPDFTDEEVRDKTTARFQISSAIHLREDNLHLRRELETLQGQLEDYQSSMDLLDGEIETIHNAHQQEIEQYQQHLREMMDERNQMYEANQELEHKYQELYRSFQDAVEEEAHKMVQEAAQTLVLSPEHAPPLLNDVVKTLETQARQTEDQRTVEVLTLLRQVQHKAEQFELESARQRQELAAEREGLHQMRKSISEQADQRYQADSARLQARWTAGLTFASITLFGVMAVLELLFYSMTQQNFAIALFVPLGICLALSYFFAHMHTSGRLKVQLQGHSQKAPAKAGK